MALLISTQYYLSADPEKSQIATVRGITSSATLVLLDVLGAGKVGPEALARGGPLDLQVGAAVFVAEERVAAGGPAIHPQDDIARQQSPIGGRGQHDQAVASQVGRERHLPFAAIALDVDFLRHIEMAE